MSFSLLSPSKALMAALALGLAGATSAAEVEQHDADSAELYEYLFPEAPRGLSAAAPSAPAGVASAPAPARFSGFMDQNRRRSWSEDQISAMRDAFKRAAPQPTAPASTPEGAPVDGDTSLFGTPPAALEGSPYAELVTRYARMRNLDPQLVHQVILAESQYNPNAVSPKGAKGLMQLMDELSNEFNIDPFDPESNINVGTQYLAKMLARFKSLDLALAAYNAGPGAVEKYNGIPPYEETQNYVSRIKAGMTKMEARNG
ncbi:lytic transglycosylase domain-containing protein [Pseudomonas aeruginosa]|uniref:lytic transglycosylase domain-containing protein n=1 Tax=Pseudomonas aeruginosa TaxID=287 RepID=UPI0009A2DD8B|nr:lytic transglycosylase domain-containing protein [Pseudomonas aeruginosa]EMA4529671.1 lytic transglycosylase domain-containing protein [Pseudomonas aeruginosa]MCU8961143.1 lytic transglycosylase domain-containing protein [Pseudomonas aeruginosa]MCU9268997.1 lytic transglycosylase domain-containing protein [Pseudomonas aeruginosa]HCF7308776.1 lytic transglycosylase domain-containing protein [Pseudomonas aeruginosa]